MPGGERYLVQGVALVSPPVGDVCVPRCGSATCGNDGCGGTCGTCAAGSACTPSGRCSAWTIETGVTVRGSNAPSPVIAATSPSMLVAFEAHGGALKGVAKRNGAWGESFALGAEPYVVAHHSSWAFDAAGEPRFAFLRYTGSTPALLTSARSGDSWTVTESPGIPRTAVNPVALARSSSGALAALVRTETTQAQGLVVLTGLPGSATVAKTFGTFLPVKNHAMAVDPAGNLHVAWIDGNDASWPNTPYYAVHYATNRGGTWITRDVTATPDVYDTTNVEVVADGNGAHVVFTGTYGTRPIAYVHVDSAGVVGPLEVVPGIGLTQVRMRLSPTEEPVVVGPSSTSGGGMELCQRSAGTWACETIDVPGSPSLPDVAYDAEGRPHVVFWERRASWNQTPNLEPVIFRHATRM
ncbi:MAG: hypothetical protein U0169_18010 [Polyangiaceae bacterium]